MKAEIIELGWVLPLVLIVLGLLAADSIRTRQKLRYWKTLAKEAKQQLLSQKLRVEHVASMVEKKNKEKKETD